MPALNAHNLVQIMLFLKQENLALAFLPYLMDSQACEAFFRKIRSFTSTYSTVANCSVKEIIGRIDKIQQQSDISVSLSDHFKFPRNRKEASAVCINLPTKENIAEEIEKCKNNAIEHAVRLGLITKKEAVNFDFECKIPAYVAKYKSNNAVESDAPGICLSKTLSLVEKYFNLKNFSDKFMDKQISSTSPYVQIMYKQKQCVVKKTSLCWLLRNDTRKLSSDRLLRVRIANDFTKKKVIRFHAYKYKKH